ncbi:MAG: hypothetical protein ACM3W4_01625 [Ignavibacteriales bacterium]
MSAHDDLCYALEDWRAAEEIAGRRLNRLRLLAINCGMASDEPNPVAWIKRRVETYRRAVAA